MVVAVGGDWSNLQWRERERERVWKKGKIEERERVIYIILLFYIIFLCCMCKKKKKKLKF